MPHVGQKSLLAWRVANFNNVVIKIQVSIEPCSQITYELHTAGRQYSGFADIINTDFRKVMPEPIDMFYSITYI